MNRHVVATIEELYSLAQDPLGVFVAIVDYTDYHSLQTLQVYDDCHATQAHPRPLQVLDLNTLRPFSDSTVEKLESLQVYSTPVFMWFRKPVEGVDKVVLKAPQGNLEAQILYRAVGTVMARKLNIEIDLCLDELPA